MAKKATVSELANLVGGRVIGDGSVEVRSVASLECADEGSVSFLGNPRFKDKALASRASALIVKEPLPLDRPQIIVEDPYAAFAQVMEFFHPPLRPAPGIHPSAVVAETARLGQDVHIGPLAVVEEEAVVLERAVIGPGAVVGRGCRVGPGTVLHAKVVLYPGVEIGGECVIHSGTVIGSDGFGFVISEKGHRKKPQVGKVVIGDRVEIGANCAIDRAMLDATVIGEGTKLDNLVHLAHGVQVGKHCLILAGVVVGGSTKLGDFCIISGNTTVKDNIVIGDRVQVVGHSVLADDVPAGSTVWGFPAMPFSHAKRVYARLKQLPDLFKRMKKVEKKLEEK